MQGLQEGCRLRFTDVKTQQLPLVRPGDRFPLGPAHSRTGYRPPVSRVILPTGLVVRVSSFGDAVPGGYNGGFCAYDEQDRLLGELDYQSANRDSRVLIAMVETSELGRGTGVSDMLLMRLAAEFPDRLIDPGLLTTEGRRWWDRVARYVRH